MQASSHPSHRLVAIGILMLAVGACDTSAPPTVTADTQSAGTSDAVTEPDAGPPPRPPRIVSVSPDRGMWLDPDAPVTITGEVRATTAPIARVLLGDVEAGMSGERFDFTPALLPGINVVDLRVEAEDDERSVDARAFFHGPVHPVGTTLANAVTVHLSPVFLDDDEPDLDDVAGVAESMLLDPAVLALLTDTPFDNEFAVITPTSIAAGGVAIDVRPLQGELELLVTLTDLAIEVDVVGKGGFADVITGPAALAVAQADATVYLPLSVVDGHVAVTDPWAKLTLEGFSLTSEPLADFLVEYPALAEALNDYVRDFIVEALEGYVSESIGDLLAGFLDGFAYDTSFGVDNPLDIHLALSTVTVAAHGLTMTLDAEISAALGQSVSLTPLSGSLATSDAAVPGDVSDAPVSFLVDDDLLNQGLFAYWFGGAASGLDLGPDALAELPLADIPEVFQPLSRVQVDLRLPLTVGPRLLEDDEFPYDVGLGELIIKLHTAEGRLFACSISARTGFGLQFTESGALSPWIDTRPRKMTVAVGCFDTPPSYDPGNVAALLRLGFPPLLRDAVENFSFDLPGLELSAFTEAPVFQGKSIGFGQLTARVVGSEKRLLLIEAAPVLRTGRRPR